MSRLFCALVCAVSVAACGADRYSISIIISTEEPGPSIAAAMVPVLSRNGISVEIEPNSDPSSILDAVKNGAADVGIVEEPGQQIGGLSTVVPLYPSILHVMYRKGRKIDGFSDLINGQQVYAGPAGGTARRLLGLLASDFMLDDSAYSLLDDPWLTEPDVFFVLGGLLAPESLARLVNYELYSFGSAEKLGSGTLAEGIGLKYPNIRPFVLPDAVYGRFNNRPILTLVTRTVMVGRNDLDSDLVYELARSLFQNAHDIAMPYHLVTRELNERVEPYTLALPLHPGSRRYVEKDEPSIVERYADVIGVGLTVVIGLGSGLLAILQYKRRRQKDRIDVFYQQVLDVRAKLADIETLGQCIELENEVRDAQSNVVKLLIAERLNVDESLTMFSDLSHQVLSELVERRKSIA